MDFAIMAITYSISTEHNIYPNLTVYDRFMNGVQYGWRVNANEGYVFYNKNENYTETNPETGLEEPVTHYYTIVYPGPSVDWNDFPYIAVPRDSVPADQIFGGGDNNDHEIM